MSFKPPQSAINNAKRGLKLRQEWGRGGLSPAEAKAQGIDSGVTRARKIASGTVSEHDVRRMSAFNRHRKNYRPDKKMPDGGPTAGTIAWLLWGGTSGVNWAKKKSAAMNAESDMTDKAEGYEVITVNVGHSMERDGRVQVFGDVVFGLADNRRSRISTFGTGENKAMARQALIDRATGYLIEEEQLHDYMTRNHLEAEDPDDPELLDYMVTVPVLHYYTVGPVEAYNPEDAEDEVVDNWRYWRSTIDNNGDW